MTEAMSAPQTVSGIDRVQPTIFAVQVALAAALKSYGYVLVPSSGTRSARLRQPWSPEHCRCTTDCESSAGARG